MEKSFHCPICQSKSTSSFERIYGSGTATYQKMMVKQAAPPGKPGNGYLFAFLGIFILGAIFIVVDVFSGIILTEPGESGVVPSFIIALIATILAGAFYFRALYKRNIAAREIWRLKYDEWRKTWGCLKCGNAWHHES